MRGTRRSIPRPFLKWVGGKGQLLADLDRRVRLAEPFGRYHEPFVGGGALFFELARQGRLGRRLAFLSDNNANLMRTYEGLKEDVGEVIDLLLDHERRHCEEYYYEVRASAPSTLAQHAARIIYLNKTGYNGLYRENSKGQFNVPFGRYKNPRVCDEPNLRACAEALKKAKLETRHFRTVVARAESGDFVYFDPPYHPVSKTASFTAYNKRGFGEDGQRELAGVFAELGERGVKALLSNSDMEFVRNLYKDFNSERVLAKRLVNSRADRRGKVSEVLVRNF